MDKSVNSDDRDTEQTLLEASECIKENKVVHVKRESWNRKIDFMVACIGGAVGLGNVWRFPYLCYKNGGGAFLIPYFLCLVFASLPLFMLEVGIGQFMSCSGTRAWSITPAFQGLGLTTTTVIFYINIYYNVILAWTVMYVFYSFSSQLPWDRCDGEWNTPSCSTNFTRDKLIYMNNSFSDVMNATVLPSTPFLINTSVTVNDSVANASNFNYGMQGNHSLGSMLLSMPDLVDPVTEFWENKVLRMSSGIEDVGDIKWDIALCLTIAWVLVYLCICKGIKSSGKVMYFTAPAPYVFMAIIIIRNATLQGAADGVFFYLRPNMSKLTEITVWTDAGMQTFFSQCICQGITVSLGSYNKFKHNFCRDSVVVAIVNAFTSFFAGFMVFTILGYMAHHQGRPIEEVAESGPGLVFIAYPKAVAQMPFSQFWSVAFFLMIFLIGLDSQFLGVEAVVTAIVDQFPNILRRPRRKELFTAVICFIHFLIGLLCITRGGIYVFQLLVYYGSGLTLMIVALLELLAVVGFYGVNRFLDNVEMMIGSKWIQIMRPYLFLSWCFTAPIVSLGLFALSCINVKNLTYDRSNGKVYNYPAWADSLGWVITVSSVLWVPFIVLHQFYKYGFSSEIFKLMLVPNKLKSHQMRPGDELKKSLDTMKNEMTEANRLTFTGDAV